jgi:hypothetical protein
MTPFDFYTKMGEWMKIRTYDEFHKKMLDEQWHFFRRFETEMIRLLK